MRHWQSHPDFLWWSASIPVQAPSITRSHTHTHACMHTHTHAVCGLWKQDRFYVQGPSIIHGIFNVNRLLQFVTISDWSLRWAARFTSCPCFYLPAGLSLYNSFCDIYCMPSQQMTMLGDLSNNPQYRRLFVLHGRSLDPLSPLMPDPPLSL